MRRAFGFLPKISDPLILDIGCGSGVPTIELAKISNGNVIGIDIDQVAIDRFQCNIEREGLMNKIEVFNQSLFDITFPKGTFDIIWSEGSIFVIGFEKGINYWSEYLKPGGFLVVHDDFKNMKKKIGIVAKSGKTLVNCFPLPKNAWWNEYYEPLKKRIDQIKMKYQLTLKDQRILQKYEKEISMVKSDPGSFRSVYFIIQIP